MELLEVMEPVLSAQIIQDEQWIHQIKWDGIRAITYIQNGSYHVFTKSGRERTAFYPEIMDIISHFKGHQAVLDGEFVVLDQNGKPSFNLVLTRDRLKTQAKLSLYMRKFPVNYVLFDILFLNGQDIRRLPLEERKFILKNNLQTNQRIGITEDFTDGIKLFNLMKEKNFEGIVSKKRDSIYLAGKKHNLWFKNKISKKILAVIGGISWKSGFPNSLLLGIYAPEQKLTYIGNASMGLTQNDFHLLKQYSASLQQDNSPFWNLNQVKDVTWFNPILTCWVSFLEWTEGYSLRHPKILGFSNEKAGNADGKELSLEC